MKRTDIPHPWIAAALWMGGILLLIPSGRHFLELAVLAVGKSGVMVAGYTVGALLLAGLGRMLLEALDGLPPWRILAAVACLVLYVVCMAGVGQPEELSHPLEYTPLALLFEQGLTSKLGPWPRTIVAAILTGLAGATDEGLQRLMPGRVGDPADVLLDFIGGVLPLLFLRIIER